MPVATSKRVALQRCSYGEPVAVAVLTSATPTAARPRRARRCSPFGIAATLIVCGVLIDLVIWNHDCNQCDASWLAANVAIVAAVVAIGLIVLAIAARGLRRLVAGHGAVRPTRRLVAVALLGALVLVSPIQLDWHDGCNSHWATVTLADAPRILILNPEGMLIGYEDASTLKGCLPAAAPRRSSWRSAASDEEQVRRQAISASPSAK